MRSVKTLGQKTAVYPKAFGHLSMSQGIYDVAHLTDSLGVFTLSRSQQLEAEPSSRMQSAFFCPGHKAGGSQDSNPTEQANAPKSANTSSPPGIEALDSPRGRPPQLGHVWKLVVRAASVKSLAGIVAILVMVGWLNVLTGECYSVRQRSLDWVSR
jgi:hypothetical protein